MTDSDMPLASATPPVASPSPQVSTRASTRARARVADTLRDGKIGRVGAAVAGDVRRWWLVTAAPPSLAEWLTSTRPASTVPDSPALKAGWVAVAWTLGLPLRVLALALFLLAGAMAWLSTHPLRVLAFLLAATAFVSYWLLGR